jgi:RNA polymerase sigma-70 factor (ECF subfamily)
MDDAVLIQQTLAGQRGAFRLLVLRWQKPIFRFLGLLGLPASSADDVAQEVFLRVFRNLANFDAQKASFSTWLFTIARRLAANDVERAHRHREELGESTIDRADPAADQLQTLAEKERGARLRRALANLPERLRSMVLLSQVEGFSTEEVAAIEGCAAGTVKSRVFRARQLLRAAMVEEES